MADTRIQTLDTQLVVKKDQLHLSIANKFSSQVPVSDFDIEIFVSFCIPAPADGKQELQNKALVAAALAEGYTKVTAFLAAETEEAQNAFMSEQAGYLDELKAKGVKVVTLLDWIKTPQFIDAKDRSDKLRSESPKAENYLKTDVTSYIKRKYKKEYDAIIKQDSNNKEKACDLILKDKSAEKERIESHIKLSADIIASKLTIDERSDDARDRKKPSHVTVYIHESSSETINAVVVSADRMGYQRNSVVVVATKDSFFETKLTGSFSVASPARVRSEPREIPVRQNIARPVPVKPVEVKADTDVSVPFDALTALVDMGKQNVDAKWVAEFINGANIQFDAISAVVTLGKQGVNPAWAAAVLSAIYFGSQGQDVAPQVLIENQRGSEGNARHTLKVTLAKDHQAMQNISDPFEPIDLESLSSGSENFYEDFRSALKNKVSKDVQSAPDASTFLVSLGKSGVDSKWSAVFFTVYHAFNSVYQKPVLSSSPPQSSLSIHDLSEFRVQQAIEGGASLAKVTLATSQQLMNSMSDNYEVVAGEKPKSPTRSTSALFSVTSSASAPVKSVANGDLAPQISPIIKF